MANARLPPLAPSRNGSPGLPRPPRHWPGLFIAARDDPIARRLLCGPGRAFERCNVGPVHQMRVGYTGPRLFSRKEAFMRTIAVAAILSAAVSLSGGARAAGAWSAHYVLHTSCGFYSYEQCEAARSGNGGFCSRNTFAANGATREPQRRFRRNY